MDVEWIKKGLEKEGKTRAGLAKALGRNPSMVTNLLKGERQLKISEVARIANYLGVLPIFEGDVLPANAPDVRYLELRGEVAGGVWSEPGLTFERVEVPIPMDGRWSEEHTYLLRVRGTSINRRAQDGDYVVCLDAYAAPRRFQSGDWVIAERERAGLVETTVKRVGMDAKGDWVLMPDSDDARFQEPIAITDHGDEVDGITIRAFVLQFVKSATTF